MHHVRNKTEGPPISSDTPMTLNYHPDALHQDQLTIETLAREGIYRSQFETRTSNGGLTAHPGGDRWHWESRIFGGAYDTAAPALRPKYGGLDLHRRGYGAAPRFGSAHVRL